MSDTAEWRLGEWGPSAPTLFDAIGRYKLAILAVTIAAALVGYAVSLSRSAEYVAAGVIFLADGGPFGAEQQVDMARRIEQEAVRIESPAVFERARDQLNDKYGGRQLPYAVEVEPDTASAILRVVATANEPALAADAANAVARAYDRESREDVQAQLDSARDALTAQVDELNRLASQLDGEAGTTGGEGSRTRQLEAIEAQIIELLTQISALTANGAIYGSGVSEFEAATAPVVPASPKPPRDAAVAAVLGLTLSCGVAYWRATSFVRREFDVRTVLQAPLLAQIPQFRRAHGGRSIDPLLDIKAIEAYQFLLSPFEYAVASSHAQSVLVTSPAPGDGKSLTALHLARALAIQGTNVVLVDADLRERGLSGILSAETEPGLASLADGYDLSDVVRRYRISPAVHLPVIPAGPAPRQPTGLFGTTTYRDALATIRSSFSMTVIDAGPLLTVADASEIAMQVDGILMVLDAGVSEDIVLSLEQRLRVIPAPLIGYVVNRVTDHLPLSERYGAMAHPGRTAADSGRLPSGSVARSHVERGSRKRGDSSG